MVYSQLLYRSKAKFHDFDLTDVQILRTAMVFNAEHGLTGLLLRVGDQFFQALHGPRDVLSRLLERIAVDTRHSDMEILMREEADPVSPFGVWSMGYDSLIGFQNGLELELDGSYPPISSELAREVFDLMVRASEGIREYGSSFPFARTAGEDDASYLARLEEFR